MAILQEFEDVVDYSVPRRFCVDSPLRTYLAAKQPSADYDVKDSVTL